MVINCCDMKTETKKLLAVALFCMTLPCAVKADLVKQIDSIIGRPSQKKVRFAVKIVKADTGRTIYQRNANKAMLPASNMKLIISAAALKYLGPEYRYITKIGFCGDSLVIIGSGDPLLGDKVTNTAKGREKNWTFDQITTALIQNGTTDIDDIIIDTSIFDDQRVHPNWPRAQLNQWYACEVSGLNYNRNCIDITTKNIGGRVAVILEPKTSFVKITNRVKAIRTGKGAVGAYRRPQKPNELIVRGKCRKQQGPFAVAIERPPAFFGFLLAQNLNKAGIRTKGQLVEKQIPQDCGFKQIIQYSTPITDCLARCNKDSFGLAAEALLKTIAAKTQPNTTGGSWAGGTIAVSKYLLEIGIPEAQFHIDDASGLSRQNRLSTNAITNVLLNLYKSKNWPIYKKSFAVGGVEGTIRRYFKEKKYKGKVFGKTGYIAGVKALSGICTTDNGDYLFSILTANANGKTRGVINDIAKAIIDQ